MLTFLNKKTEHFVTFNNERAYKAEDLSKWNNQGEIEILGRNDNQIKLRGLRIELGEIEKLLSSIPEIKTSVVMIKKIQIMTIYLLIMLLNYL